MDKQWRRVKVPGPENRIGARLRLAAAAGTGSAPRVRAEDVCMQWAPLPRLYPVREGSGGSMKGQSPAQRPPVDWAPGTHRQSEDSDPARPAVGENRPRAADRLACVRGEGAVSFSGVRRTRAGFSD